MTYDEPIELPIEIFLLFYWQSEENILRTHRQKYFSPHLNCHHHLEV